MHDFLWDAGLALAAVPVILAIVYVLVSTKSDRHRRLRYGANFTLAYPIIVVGLFYADWFLSWYNIGHKPSIWGDDDPYYDCGSKWLYTITFFALAGVLPVGCLSVISHIAHVYCNRLSAAQASLRLFTLVSLWLGMICWFISDGHQIMVWWID
jgi:hypothetical protein